MNKPLVCFLSYNRAGSSCSNLKALLETDDDFELCIVDNGSSDGIWEFIEKLKDDRIKFKHRFSKNNGVVYAINFGLSKREKNQPFIHVENDVWIKDPHWIKKFEKTRNEFNDLGLIGAVSKGHFDTKLKSLEKQHRNNISCFYSNMVIGCCNYLTPETIELIGYWNEECCGADKEIGARINLCTPFKTGYTGLFTVDFRTSINCSECALINDCKFSRITPCECCNVYYPTLYTHKSFSNIANTKTIKYIHDLKDNKRSCFSASIHDKDSLEKNFYDRESALENFNFFSNFNITSNN